MTKENQVKISVEFQGYEEALKKHNIYLSDFDILNEYYEITLIEKTYKKLGRKNFPKKPTEEKNEKISARQYACYMSSIGFFGDRVYMGYEQWGYKPYRIVCTSPDNETKIERIFKFKHI